MARRLALPALLVAMGFFGCHRHDDGSGPDHSNGAGLNTPLLWLGQPAAAGGGGIVTPGGTTILTNSVIPVGTPPPVGVDFVLAFAEDVLLLDLIQMGTLWQTASAILWQVSEGQVFINTVSITDNVAPFTFSTDLGTTYNPNTLDVVIWPPAKWNEPFPPPAAYVLYQAGLGRNDRIMALQTNSNVDTALHELMHFLFVLSWRYYQMPAIVAALDDEYLFLPDTENCIMEANFGAPNRLCSDGALPNPNHLVHAMSVPPNTTQAWQVTPNVWENGQPVSCWEQIILDYAGWTYLGNDSTTVPTPPTTVTINNTGI